MARQQHPRHQPRASQLLLVATAAASALVMIATIALGVCFGHLNARLRTEPMSVIGPLPPPSRAGVLTILALGSQTRDGQGPGFGHDPGTDLSDTAMLIHVNAARTRAIVVSIPRDLLVYRPPCKERTGGDAVIGARRDAMFDSAMNLGGPACAVATVQDMSGIRVDHFIRVDFNGFRTMTDALGGVEVCVPPPGIRDWRSHLYISAGLHVVSGQEALAFVRDRHGIGNGGDLGRIEMQQMFVSSLIRKIMSNGTLTNLVTLYRIADIATRSLTTDPGLGSVQALLGLAQSLRSLRLSAITFVTLPSTLDPANIDRLLPLEPAASDIWRMLRDDQPWTPFTERAVPSAAPIRPPPRTGTAAAAPVALPAPPAPSTTPALTTPPGPPAPPALTTLPGPLNPSAPLDLPASTAPPARPDAGHVAAPVQARNASENICSGLPAPNNQGETGK